MLSKKYKYSIIFTYSLLGLIGGIAIGLLLSIGQLNYTKKSQREDAAPIFAIGFSVLFGLVGIGYAYKKAEDEIKNQELGLDKIDSTKKKDGRKWIYESSWSTMEKKSYLLRTYHDKETKNTITTINDELLVNHETTTGAEKFINKEHFKALEQYKSFLKEKHSI